MKLHYRPELRKVARTLRSSGNLAEALLWKELKAKRLGVQFLRQRPVLNYVVDFYCEKLGLAIEVDGISHDAKIEKDVLRQRMLEAEGVRVLRFLDSDVRYNMESVVRAIQENLNPPPRPPAGGSAPPFRKEEPNALCIFGSIRL